MVVVVMVMVVMGVMVMVAVQRTWMVAVARAPSRLQEASTAEITVTIRTARHSAVYTLGGVATSAAGTSNQHNMR